jgi:hypothetical protein
MTENGEKKMAHLFELWYKDWLETFNS